DRGLPPRPAPRDGAGHKARERTSGGRRPGVRRRSDARPGAGRQTRNVTPKRFLSQIAFFSRRMELHRLNRRPRLHLLNRRALGSAGSVFLGLFASYSYTAAMIGRDLRIGVVGATGLVGQVTLRYLVDRGYTNIRTFASWRSAGGWLGD